MPEAVTAQFNTFFDNLVVAHFLGDPVKARNMMLVVGHKYY